MKLFSALYARAMRWSRHRHAPWYPGGMSSAESSFFPIPPDAMLTPMSLANPSKAWRFALIATLASVAGGLFGYFTFDAIEPWLRESHYWAAYQNSIVWFEKWGFWALFVAGFSPIPYKVFTIAAGALSMALLPFTLASLIGRGARMEALLHRTIDRLGWATVALVVIGAVLYQWAGAS